ncbi:MAG: hypothetical protein L0Z62_12545 [Gemmataceae bacterium]|nr:hypothetical protein [Gemmataceae bacterium]
MMSNFPGPPASYRDTGQTVMSNFDHSIDRRLEARLRAERVVMLYAGRDFCGDVWWEPERRQYVCLVLVCGTASATVIRPTLEEIMEYVCREYGPE